MTGVTITPVGSLSEQRLADRLNRIVEADGVRLAEDFPRLPARYGTFDQAKKSVLETIAAVQQSSGKYGVWAIQVRAGASESSLWSVVGLVTALQMDFVGRTGFMAMQKVRVTGPQIAMWMGATVRETKDTRYLARVVLMLLARQLMSNPAFQGRPHTLVRENRQDGGYMRTTLGTVGNGFGDGFREVQTGVIWRGDGSWARRVLMAAPDLNELRLLAAAEQQ